MELKKQRLLDLVGRKPRNQSISYKKQNKVSTTESHQSLKITNNTTIDRSLLVTSMPGSSKTNVYQNKVNES